MEDETIVPAPASVYKAEVWRHFGFHYRQGTKEIDKSHAVCKMCNANVKYSKNTTNLRAHIMRHHSDVPLTEQQQQTANGKRVDPLQLTLEQVHTSKLPPTSTRATKITQSVLYFICKDMRPLSVVENEGFRYMLKTLEPCYTIPSRQHITDIAVPNLYKEVKMSILESLSSAERVALTCDAWTSRATESFVTITAHYITTEWNLVSYVLQTRAMHDSHTGGNIAELLKEAVTEWGLEEKHPVIVTDNASKYECRGWTCRHDPRAMFRTQPESRFTESTEIASCGATSWQDQTCYKLFQTQHHCQPPTKTQTRPAAATKTQVNHRCCHKVE